jgi:hypothetical protein
MFIIIVALALAAQLLWDRRRRDRRLPGSDRRHFLLQDVRRVTGICLMDLLAVGVYIGSRLPTRVIVSASEAHPNRLFLADWLAVFAFLTALVGLAVLDWIATRRYARRHRDAMNKERIEILGDTVRKSRAAEDGHSNGSDFPRS